MQCLSWEQSVTVHRLSLSGNVLTSIGIQPKPGVQLIDWDITDTLSPANDFLGRDVYLIAFNRGLDINSLNFTLKFKVWNKQTNFIRPIPWSLICYNLSIDWRQSAHRIVGGGCDACIIFLGISQPAHTIFRPITQQITVVGVRCTIRFIVQILDVLTPQWFSVNLIATRRLLMYFKTEDWHTNSLSRVYCDQ